MQVNDGDLFHYRDKSELEVNLIVRLRDGTRDCLRMSLSKVNKGKVALDGCEYVIGGIIWFCISSILKAASTPESKYTRITITGFILTIQNSFPIC